MSHPARRVRLLPSHPMLLTLVLAATCVASAQPVQVGPFVGYEYGVPLTVARSAGTVNTYDYNGDGTSSNHTATFGATLRLRDLFGHGVGLSPRLALGLSTGLFESTTPFRLIDNSGPIARIYDIRFDVYSSLSIAQLELPVVLDVDGDLSIGVAPWVSYRLSSAFLQTEYIVAPDTATFRNGRTSRTVAGGNGIASAATHWGALGMVGWDLHVADGIVLRPEIFGRLDAQAFLVDLDSSRSRAFSGGVSISLLLPFGASETPERAIADVPPTIARADTPQIAAARQRPLSASIELSLAPDSPLESSGTLERIEAPFEPSVAFGEGSAQLPGELATMTPERASRFSVDSLAHLPAAQLERRAVDVAALRLRDTPGATATVIGGFGSGEDRSLGVARAAALRSYLHDVWSIDSARVRVAVAKDRAETRIDMAPALEEPIVARWITRSYRAPRLGLRHDIEAPAGVRFWEIVLRQGPRVVARTSATTGDSLLSADLLLNGISTPIVGELSAIDSAGSLVVVRDTLLLSGSVVQGPIRRERREVIVAPGSDLAETARAIAATTIDGARIVIGRLDGADSEGPTPARFAALLLAKLAARDVDIAELRVGGDGASNGDASSLQGGLQGALRVVVEQPYGEREN
jgi:hypothetical protein